MFKRDVIKSLMNTIRFGQSHPFQQKPSLIALTDVFTDPMFSDRKLPESLLPQQIYWPILLAFTQMFDQFCVFQQKVIPVKSPKRKFNHLPRQKFWLILDALYESVTTLPPPAGSETNPVCSMWKLSSSCLFLWILLWINNICLQSFFFLICSVIDISVV